MRHKTSPPTWRQSVAALCVATAGCTATPPAPDDQRIPALNAALARLAQRGHGGEATFALCHGNACPQRTPKTMPLASGAPQTAAMDAPSAPPAPAHVPVEPGEHTLPPKAPAFTDTHASPSFEQFSVHFSFASALLDATSRAALREAALGLVQAHEITLSGRTDSTGPAAANDRLAKARVHAVLRELLHLAPGVASRVSVDAHGACCFVDSNDGPAGRARNRRVDIRYRLGSDAPS